METYLPCVYTEFLTKRKLHISHRISLKKILIYIIIISCKFTILNPNLPFTSWLKSVPLNTSLPTYTCPRCHLVSFSISQLWIINQHDVIPWIYPLYCKSLLSINSVLQTHKIIYCLCGQLGVFHFVLGPFNSDFINIFAVIVV